MKEVLGDIERWQAEGRRVAIARVVGTEGSSPRDPGATMAVNDAGEVAGSVSGGCVEGAVVQEALAILSGEKECQLRLLRRRGIRGRAHVWRHHPALRGAVGLVSRFEELRDALRAGEPVALATVIEGSNIGAKLLVRPDGQASGSLGDANLDRVVARDARGELEAGLTSTRHYGAHGEARERDVSVFIESFALPPRMIIFGAVDFTAALAKVAKVLGYRVTVCDARAVFATVLRFPMADEVVNDWPDRYLAKVGDELGPRDAICVLTHDHKFDVPAIAAAVKTGVGYLGAMGSRRTHEQRSERLREAGLADAEIARVMSPVGLDIGARTPEETAVAICAEVIALRTGRRAQSLRDTAGPIH